MAVALDLRVSLQKLEALARVVELGGVGRAAEDLHVVQPAVTAQIRSLEERVGARLFERTGRQVSLTPAGRVVYLWAEDVLARTRAVETELAELSAGTAGRAYLGADPTAAHLLSPVLERLSDDLPGADIRLTVADVDRLVRVLHRQAIGLAVIVGPPRPWSHEVVAMTLGAAEHVLVGSRRAPVAEAILAAQLAGLPFVDAPESLLPAGAGANVTLQIADPEARKRAALETDGLTVLPRAAVEAELADGTLRAIAIRDADLQIPVDLLRLADHPLTPLQARLVDALRDELASA